MATLKVSMPEELKIFVDEQVDGGRYSDGSELITALLRREWAKEQLRALIQEGLDSPLEGPMDDAFFESMRERIRSHARAVAE